MGKQGMPKSCFYGFIQHNPLKTTKIYLNKCTTNTIYMQNCGRKNN